MVCEALGHGQQNLQSHPGHSGQHEVGTKPRQTHDFPVPWWVGDTGLAGVIVSSSLPSWGGWRRWDWRVNLSTGCGRITSRWLLFFFFNFSHAKGTLLCLEICLQTRKLLKHWKMPWTRGSIMATPPVSVSSSRDSIWWLLNLYSKRNKFLAVLFVFLMFS